MDSLTPGNAPFQNEVLQENNESVLLSLGNIETSTLVTSDLDNESKKFHTTQKDKRKSKRQLDPKYKEKERIKNLERSRKLRADPDFRDKERLRNRIGKRKARQDPYYREAEKMRNKLQKRKARENPAFREAERKRNLRQKRKAREDPAYRIRERVKRLERKISWNMSTEEWMEMGSVNIDSEAKVAFDNGLFRLMPADYTLTESFKLRTGDSKYYSPEDTFSGFSQMEKDLFTKLYFSSRDHQTCRPLDSSSLPEEFGQSDHNHYIKLEKTSETATSQKSKENDSNQSNVNIGSSSRSIHSANGVNDLHDMFHHRHFLDLSGADGVERRNIHYDNDRSVVMNDQMTTTESRDNNTKENLCTSENANIVIN